MGYGYAETFLIVFLTHPGVIIPASSSVIGKFTSNLPPDVANIIPTSGTPPIVSGLWQVLWYWILGLPGDKSAGFGWTMYVIYLVFLLLYIYKGVGLRLSLGV
jgi:hypothetical protein